MGTNFVSGGHSGHGAVDLFQRANSAGPGEEEHAVCHFSINVFGLGARSQDATVARNEIHIPYNVLEAGFRGEKHHT